MKLKSKAKIFILGDFKINYDGENKNKTKLQNSLKGLGLNQVINQHTILGENSTLIDLILTNSNSI